MKIEVEAHLEFRLAEMGAALSPQAQSQFLALAEILEAWGQRMNLTGHRDAVGIVDGLLIDAIAMERELPEAGSLVDLGSGAGFPGLPLALIRPDSQVVLVDSREKRHHFQKAAIRHLGLKNVTPRRGRIEELAPEPAELVIAQALAQPAAALELGLPWSVPGGWIALPGTETPPSPGEHSDIATMSCPQYRVPGREAGRSLWIGQRHP